MGKQKDRQKARIQKYNTSSNAGKNCRYTTLEKEKYDHGNQ